jgi:hypothetical protein
MHRVTACKAEEDYRLWIRFDDGLEGSVFLGDLLEIGAFKLWCDVREFEKGERRSGNGDGHVAGRHPARPGCAVPGTGEERRLMRRINEFSPREGSNSRARLNSPARKGLGLRV